MSVLVVVGVPEGGVSGVEVCQYVDRDVCVVEEVGETVEREPGIRSAVCGGQ